MISRSKTRAMRAVPRTVLIPRTREGRGQSGSVAAVGSDEPGEEQQRAPRHRE